MSPPKGYPAPHEHRARALRKGGVVVQLEPSEWRRALFGLLTTNLHGSFANHPD